MLWFLCCSGSWIWCFSPGYGKEKAKYLLLVLNYYIHLQTVSNYSFTKECVTKEKAVKSIAKTPGVFIWVA